MAPQAHEAPAYFLASGCSALLNYPLWKASAIGQAGYKLKSKTAVGKYFEAIQPPWRGAFYVVGGLTWARAAIFFGSDYGRARLREQGVNSVVATALPPLAVSVFVQCVNMPLVRSSIMLQDPNTHHKSVASVAREIISRRGYAGLWHGLSAGIAKTVPKYVTAVMIKQWMDQTLEPADPTSPYSNVLRSAKKAVTAGVAGAVLTNPFDVIRNTMFKTDLNMINAIRHLHKEQGWAFVARGMGNNLIAVAVPIAATIFLTDLFSRQLSFAPSS